MSAERSGSACAEVRRLLLEGPSGADDAATEARVAAHLGRCAGCQAVRDRLQAVRADVERAAAPLDDMRRARVLARLASALDDQAAEGGARRRAAAGPGQPARQRRMLARGLLAAAFGGAAAAALGVWLWARPPAQTAGAPAPVVAAAPATPAPAADLAVLRPYASAPGQAPGVAPVAAPVDRLQLPAGTRLRLQLGARATATLIGPARLRVARNQPDLLEVELAQGTLVADYDHRAGGQLLVRSPGALTRVVGTLFSVKAAPRGSRIVVARGRVLVTGARGPAHTLSAGDALETASAAPGRWTREDRQPLQQHARAGSDPVAPAAAPSLRPARLAQRTSMPPAELPAPEPESPPAPLDAPAPASAPIAPSVAARAPAVPPAALPAAEALYQRAEQAMRRRDWDTARRQLGEMIALQTGHPLEDVARYELAQLALRAGDRAQAVALVEDLLRSDREPALRLPAWLLRCELHLAAHERAQGRRCLERFRSQHPDSPHDEAALGLLIETLNADAACDGAAPIAGEYLQRYPTGARAGDARRLQVRCNR